MDRDEFLKMAAVEDAMWYYRALHRHVIRQLARDLPGPAPSILDAGCGTGGLLRRLQEARPGSRLSGLDLSPLACGLAAERSGVAVRQGSVAALPYADADFDAIVSCDVLCQTADPAAALREFFRCLRPGGCVLLTLPAYQWMYSYHDRAVGNIRRYTRGEVEALVRAAGFHAGWSTYWNLLPFPLAVVRRKLLPPPAAGSDVRRFPAPLEAGFNGLMALERGWLNLGGRLPFGSSVLTVGRKSPLDNGAHPT